MVQRNTTLLFFFSIRDGFCAAMTSPPEVVLRPLQVEMKGIQQVFGNPQSFLSLHRIHFLLDGH